MGIATGAAIHFVPEYSQFRKFKAVVIICGSSDNVVMPFWPTDDLGLVSAVTADLVIAVSMVTYTVRGLSLNEDDPQIPQNNLRVNVAKSTRTTYLDKCMYLVSLDSSSWGRSGSHSVVSDNSNRPVNFHMGVCEHVTFLDTRKC